MRFLILSIIAGLLINAQLLFAEKFYNPGPKATRREYTNQADSFRSELMQHHALNKLNADYSQRDRAIILPPVFKLDKANYVDPFWHHWSDPDFKKCQRKFASWSASRVLHQIQAYRYPGFRKYAESLPEFENFLLTMSSDLDKRGQDGCIARELFLADSKHANQIINYLTNKRNYYVEQQQIKQLKQVGFAVQAVQLLREQRAVAQFNYESSGHAQATQYAQIKEHINDLARFRDLDRDLEIAQIITQDSFDYALMANRANRENLTTVSDLFLTISKNVLSLGKGLVINSARNVVSLIDPRTYKHCFDLIGKLGVSLADAAEHLLEVGLATLTNDQQVILELQERRDQKVIKLQNEAGHLCQHLKQTWQKSDLEERSEIIGGVLADGLFVIYGGKANASLLRTGGKILAPLSKYKPMALAKLGELGREVKQVTGLAYTKGREYVQTGLDVIESCPELAKIQQPLSATIRHCTKKIQTVNNYFQNKLQKRFYRQLQAAATGVESEMVLHLSPEKQLFLLNDGQVVKPKTGLVKPNGNLLNSAGSNLVHQAKIGGQILTDEEIFATAISGITRENRIFFDHFGNKFVDKAACKEICSSILDNSIFDKTKYPACLQHYASQIAEVEKYLAGMTLWEFFNYARQVPEHMRHLPVRVDYLHLIHPMPEIKLLNGKYVAKKFKGFHLDHGGVLEKAGEIRHEILRYGLEGSYESNVFVKGFHEPETKTMFSPDCTLLDVVKTSREASCNSSYFMVNPNSSLAIKGKTCNNLPIFTSFNEQGTNPLRILRLVGYC